MKQILFTEPYKAELVEVEKPTAKAGEVIVRNLYTTVSAGTERANLVGASYIDAKDAPVIYPRALGYCGVGVIESVGEGVSGFQIGDQVIAYGKHAEYVCLPQDKVFKIEDDMDPLDVALAVIATFPMLAVRRTRLELGEGAIVFGLGILGQIAVQLCKIAGAYPVIAVDLNQERRDLALSMGADFAFDSSEPDFRQKVMDVTKGKGAEVVIEVTGLNDVIRQSLQVIARMGRLALLGCSRTPISDLDFYHDVHFQGVSIVGTHTAARATLESAPGNWTLKDDISAIEKLVKGKKLDLRSYINEIHSPAEAEEVYNVLAREPQKFPIGVVFDWSRKEGK